MRNLEKYSWFSWMMMCIAVSGMAFLSACSGFRLDVEQSSPEEEIYIEDGSGSVTSSSPSVQMAPAPRDALNVQAYNVIPVYQFLALRDANVPGLFPQAFDQIIGPGNWVPVGVVTPQVRFELNLVGLTETQWGPVSHSNGSNVRHWISIQRNVPMLPYNMRLKNSTIRELHFARTQNAGVWQLQMTFSGPGYRLLVRGETYQPVGPVLNPTARIRGDVSFSGEGVSVASGSLGNFDVDLCSAVASSLELATQFNCY